MFKEGESQREGLAMGENVKDDDGVVEEVWVWMWVWVWKVVGGAAGEGNGILGLIWDFPSSGRAVWRSPGTAPLRVGPADLEQGRIKVELKLLSNAIPDPGRGRGMAWHGVVR